MVEADLYDYLVTTQIGEVTLPQLDSATKSTYINQSNIEFWRGPITVSKVIEASRTYPHGLPIPDQCAVSTNTIANGAQATVKPSGTEIWRVQSIHSAADMTVTLYDGTTHAALMSGTSPQVFSNLFITPTLYLAITNGSGDAAVCNISYCKVGL
jgi:hypothetical protein